MLDVTATVVCTTTDSCGVRFLPILNVRPFSNG